MGDDILASLVAVATAIVGLGIIAVVLSKSSDTANVLQTGGSFFSTLLSKAVSPVSN